MSKIKVGDTVIVKTGKDRNKIGQVEVIVGVRVLVSGINRVKRHQKKSAASPQGGIIEKNLPIHLSNVMLIDPKTKKPARVRFNKPGKGKERVFSKSGEAVNVKQPTK